MLSQVTDDAARTVQYILSPFGVNFQEMLKVYQQSTKSSDVQEKKEKWLTMEESCKYAKVSRWTLRRWGRDRGLKILKTSNARCARLLISKESLDAILESLSISGAEIK